MGRLCPQTTEDEVIFGRHNAQLMRKVCYLFDSTREKLVREQQLPEFSFEDFVEAWDENDKFIKRLFEFFIKETAMRHFMKKNPSIQAPELIPNTNNSYSNLVDLALNVATTPRSSNIQTSNIHRVLHNTLQEDQSARQGWMISSRNLNTSRDRRRFRPQSSGVTSMLRQQPEDEAATTRVYRSGSSLIATPNRSVNSSHAALIDQAILDLLPLPAGVVSITHGLPFRRPIREQRSNINAGQEEYYPPGQVQFLQIDHNMETQ